MLLDALAVQVPTSPALGLVQGGVCLAQQVVGAGRSVGGDGHADAGASAAAVRRITLL